MTKKRAVNINMRAVKDAYALAMNQLEEAGERPAAALVLAALIIRVHARLAGTPESVTFENVRSLIEQLDRQGES